MVIDMPEQWPPRLPQYIGGQIVTGTGWDFLQ